MALIIKRFKDCFEDWSVFQKKLNECMDKVSTFSNGEDEDLKGLYELRMKRNCEIKCVFALENKKYIGMITFSTKQDTIDINDLYVEEEYRSQGIGEKLINYVKSKLGKRKLFVGTPGGNERAVKFYQKMGFKILAYDLQLQL